MFCYGYSFEKCAGGGGVILENQYFSTLQIAKKNNADSMVLLLLNILNIIDFH